MKFWGSWRNLLSHPRQPRMPNMLLIGDTNNGKTHLIKHFLRSHPADENPGGEHINAPVLFVNAPPSPSEDGLYIEILNALFEHVPMSSTDARRNRVYQVLKNVQLKVLVIDDLHNILAGTTTKTHVVLNMLKYLGNKLEISIVGCGTGDLLRAVSISPEIENRFEPQLLPRWESGKDYNRLLSSFESTLPLRRPSSLATPEMSKKILAMSERLIGEMSKLLTAAAIHAIKHGEEQITPEVLNACGFVPPGDRKQRAAHM